MSFYRIRILIIKNAVYASTVCSLFIFYSCKNADPKPAVNPYENGLGIRPANLAQIDTVHYTTIEWTEPHKQLGTVHHGDSVILKYRFKNTGIHPLFIYAVHPSCGCTLPRQLPNEALMPGNENELRIVFNSNGQQGQVYKTITVTSNTSNSVQHVLSYEALVDTLPKN